jgi:hypothetical protein
MNGSNTRGVVIESPGCNHISPQMCQPGSPFSPRPHDEPPPPDLFDRPLPKNVGFWGNEPADKPVLCIATGEIYPNVVAAAQAVGVSRQLVTRHANAKRPGLNVRFRWCEP